MADTSRPGSRFSPIEETYCQTLERAEDERPVFPKQLIAKDFWNSKNGIRKCLTKLQRLSTN